MKGEPTRSPHGPLDGPPIDQGEPTPLGSDEGYGADNPHGVNAKRDDRILWNRGGQTIDEIVVHDCTVHVEQMSDHCWWIGIYKPDGTHWAGNFYCPHYRSKYPMTFTEQESGLVWDRDEEHP